MGLVLCEDCEFAVPCLATDVGGIPDVVKNGINGRTFGLESSAGSIVRSYTTSSLILLSIERVVFVSA